MDGDSKREIILGGPDTDQMVNRGLPTLFILESLHEVSTAVAEKESTLPTAFALSQNYPNHFNPSTTIEYDLTKATKVQITIYSVLGV